MKKSYRGFPIPALLIILGVLIAAQLFSNSLTDQRGVRIESAKLLEYIEQGAFDAVGLIRPMPICPRARSRSSIFPPTPTIFPRWWTEARS